MAQFGELLGGPKLRKETTEDAETGERFGHGPLDLESGVISVHPTPALAQRSERSDEDG
jgi:hypothetical protein